MSDNNVSKEIFYLGIVILIIYLLFALHPADKITTIEEAKTFVKENRKSLDELINTIDTIKEDYNLFSIEKWGKQDSLIFSYHDSTGYNIIFDEKHQYPKKVLDIMYALDIEEIERNKLENYYIIDSRQIHAYLLYLTPENATKDNLKKIFPADTASIGIDWVYRIDDNYYILKTIDLRDFLAH